MRVNISVNILSVGELLAHYHYSFPEETEKKPVESPFYFEPLTTNIETIEIRYDKEGEYKAPETTG